MATTYEQEQIFNESLDRLAANLMANLNKKDGVLESYWAAARAQEFSLEGGQQLRQVFGVTSAHMIVGEERTYVSFGVTLIALSPTASRVQVVVVSPAPLTEDVHLPGDPVPDARLPFGMRESTRLVKVAEHLLELCLNPDAETDTGMMHWLRKFNRLVTQGKDKRKPGDE